jgi:hypothetical protein
MSLAASTTPRCPKKGGLRSGVQQPSRRKSHPGWPAGDDRRGLHRIRRGRTNPDRSRLDHDPRSGIGAGLRRQDRGRTAIGAGIDLAVQALAESGLNTTRRVTNAGRDVSAARDDAIRAGITINGLAIVNDHPVSWNFAHVQPPDGLPLYYEQNVTGGLGSFVLVVHDFQSFGEAMTRKLVTEIASR